MRALLNITKMLQTTALFSRRVLLTSVNLGQDARKLSTAAQEAQKRRSLAGRVAVVTASTDGYIHHILDFELKRLL